MKVRDARLRDRVQSLLFGFLPEIAGDQMLDDFGLDVFGKALPNHGGGHFTLAEAGKAGHLLELIDNNFGFAGNYFRRDFDVNFAQGWISCSCGFGHWSSLLFDSAAYEYAATYRI